MNILVNMTILSGILTDTFPPLRNSESEASGNKRSSEDVR